MGMFDTIHLKAPLVCPTCGAEVRDFQTKEFDCSLADLKIGSVLAGSSVLSGIVADDFWCEACYKADQQPSHWPVYLIVWHSILAGVEQDLSKAEARLAAVDRLDLIAWLDEAQRETLRWQRHYHKLHSDVRRWHEHLARAAAPPEPAESGENAERTRKFRHFFLLPEEILTAPDPLAAILAANDHKDEETDITLI